MTESLWAQLADWKQNCTWVDLSHVLSEDTPHWSGFPAMSRSAFYEFPSDGFFAERIEIATQYGTHIDAPSHFAEGKPSVDSFTAADVVLPLCVVDIVDKVRADPDYALTVQDLLDWEGRHGTIPAGCFVAARTDWYKLDDLDNPDAEGNKHYPGWTLDAIKFLVEQRDIAALGHEASDTAPAIAVDSDEGFACEYYLLEKGRFQIELMRSLDQVPPTGSIIFCGFPRLKGGPGFAARCIAVCPKG